jgi:hypothetical protein
MELTGPPRKADRGVRGTLTKFKRRRGVAKSVRGNVIVDDVGIIVALPKILEPGELVQSRSFGAGNTGRAHDLENDRRIDGFRAGRDGAALSQRARR